MARFERTERSWRRYKSATFHRSPSANKQPSSGPNAASWRANGGVPVSISPSSSNKDRKECLSSDSKERDCSTNQVAPTSHPATRNGEIPSATAGDNIQQTDACMNGDPEKLRRKEELERVVLARLGVEGKALREVQQSNNATAIELVRADPATHEHDKEIHPKTESRREGHGAPAQNNSPSKNKHTPEHLSKSWRRQQNASFPQSPPANKQPSSGPNAASWRANMGVAIAISPSSDNKKREEYRTSDFKGHESGSSVAEQDCSAKQVPATTGSHRETQNGERHSPSTTNHGIQQTDTYAGKEEKLRLKEEPKRAFLARLETAQKAIQEAQHSQMEHGKPSPPKIDVEERARVKANLKKVAAKKHVRAVSATHEGDKAINPKSDSRRERHGEPAQNKSPSNKRTPEHVVRPWRRHESATFPLSPLANRQPSGPNSESWSTNDEVPVAISPSSNNNNREEYLSSDSKERESPFLAPEQNGSAKEVPTTTGSHQETQDGQRTSTSTNEGIQEAGTCASEEGKARLKEELKHNVLARIEAEEKALREAQEKEKAFGEALPPEIDDEERAHVETKKAAARELVRTDPAILERGREVHPGSERGRESHVELVQDNVPSIESTSEHVSRYLYGAPSMHQTTVHTRTELHRHSPRAVRQSFAPNASNSTGPLFNPKVRLPETAQSGVTPSSDIYVGRGGRDWSPIVQRLAAGNHWFRTDNRSKYFHGKICEQIKAIEERRTRLSTDSSQCRNQEQLHQTDLLVAKVIGNLDSYVSGDRKERTTNLREGKLGGFAPFQDLDSPCYDSLRNGGNGVRRSYFDREP